MNLELMLHFLKFDIRTESLELKDWIERLYISNDLTADLANRSASLELHVEKKDSGLIPDIGQPNDAIFAETNLCNSRCYYRGGKFFSANYGEYWHEMEYDLDASTIRAQVGGRYLDSGQFIVSHMTRPILQSFILPFYGIKSLHGAVLTKGGKTVFLSGPGGMGKSTTALQLRRGGYEILSDDGPFFIVEGPHVFALSSLDYVHLTDGTLRMFPEIAERRVGEKDHREKYSVKISDIPNAGAFRRPARITHFIRLHRGNDVAVPKAKKADRSSVQKDLIDENMIIFRQPAFRKSRHPFKEYSAFVFDLLSKVARDADTFDLEFADRHLAQIPAILDQL